MHYYSNNFKPLQFLWIAMVFLIGCKTDKSEYVQLRGNAQGTTFSIKYKSDGLVDYSGEIDSLFNVINLSMSTYHPESIISKINQGDSSIVLDKHFIKVFNQSLQIYNETNGAFDPTVGIIVNAYGFGPNKVDKIDESKLDSLRLYVGLNKVTIQNSKLIRKYLETVIDFNAIAQGYTVDVVAEFLKSKNILDYMIEIGGEVKAAGLNPDGKLWSIGIQNPEKSAENSLETIVKLNNKSLATSGNYRKFKIDETGKKFVHTINPITGRNEINDLLSATVITKNDCSLADAYATSLMVMGYEKSLDFIKNHPELEVFLIYVDDNGQTQIFSNIKE
jgi:thiamine biosynthesis lipoprotein